MEYIIPYTIIEQFFKNSKSFWKLLRFKNKYFSTQIVPHQHNAGHNHFGNPFFPSRTEQRLRTEYRYRREHRNEKYNPQFGNQKPYHTDYRK